MSSSIKPLITLALSAGLLPSVTFAVPEAPHLAPRTVKTKTPIKHVIMVVGENVTFDTLYLWDLPSEERTKGE